VTEKLIGLEEAREIVLESSAPISSEPVALDAALGRVLAQDVVSEDPVPGFDNSAMDGFAIRSADCAAAAVGEPVRLEIVGESRAGKPAATTLVAGQAIRISTGAMVPGGADAILRLEEAVEADGSLSTKARVEPGRDIRRAGEDVRPGQMILSTGTVIGASELGVLASLGRPEVECRRRPVVSIVSSGDELVMPGEPMRPGAVRDTNGWSVPALARIAGAEVLAPVRAADEPVATREVLAAALQADVAVVCGGVSVGEHDHVRGALGQLGATQRFWGVALRPGRPTWFGTFARPTGESTLVFGLPGNPVSAIVTFLLFVDPALRGLLGADTAGHRTIALLDSGYEKRPGRTHAVRVRLELGHDGWHAQPTKQAQASHVLTSMLGADGLALIPAERESLGPGERVEVELIPRL
jgi:molybdopterin molybdotransferase